MGASKAKPGALGLEKGQGKPQGVKKTGFGQEKIKTSPVNPDLNPHPVHLPRHLHPRWFLGGRDVRRGQDRVPAPPGRGQCPEMMAKAQFVTAAVVFCR